MRATGVGVGTATSRIGSAASTYLMPLALTSIGASGAMAIGAAITLAAFIVCYFLAPETRGISLHATSGDYENAFPESPRSSV